MAAPKASFSAVKFPAKTTISLNAQMKSSGNFIARPMAMNNGD